MARKQQYIQIKDLFLKKYANAQTELHYNNIYELLIAVILSAQCTDKRVNIVTPLLFTKYPSTKELSKANIDDLKEIIKSVSFFNNKAKNLILMAQSVESDFNGVIPTNQQDLMKLHGVGQKTANVVLGEFFDMNYMAVDTHVFRVSHRLGLSKSKTALQTETDLTKIFKDNLNLLHQAFVLFGRYECKAVRPQCENCFVKQYCKDSKNFKPQ
ncbi:endonuclease III [Helicobacter didelphidarum]|uniref:Endonuclease III n=1 Tax=Helicobacter didelphidarum TaxID=2040648 RepID=A0A3D8IJU4_9HELI|nr:endonuclease III [Helicobacter didelphidarum]RDU65393.1 endonuclease III [Helicobacter didelphidarum]